MSKHNVQRQILPAIVPKSFDANDSTYSASWAWTTAELEGMDAKFRQRVLDAIASGAECCATAVSTAPGTKRPIANYQRV